MPCLFQVMCLQRRTFVRVPLAALVLWLAGSSAAAADTIVLKNGRRIVALTVVEDGDKVRYQTAAGELTLPKSIVDHIEKGGAVDLPESREASNDGGQRGNRKGRSTRWRN
jgi:outer membrane biogenesis lipoprotein LolB